MTQDEEKSLVRKAKELFRVGHYEVSEALLEGVRSRGGWAHLDKKEEGAWLLGLIAKRAGRYRDAANHFNEGLSASVTLFSSGERSAPSRICMESLKGRATCYLYLYEYARSIKDFKEWLRLRAIYSPEADPTSSFYNLGLCYKHTSTYSAAEHFFSLATSSASFGNIHQESNKARATAACMLVREYANTSEESVRDALNALAEHPEHCESEGVFVTQLLAFRTKLHGFLSRQSYDTLQANIERERDPARKKAFKWGLPSRWMGEYLGEPLRSVHTEARPVILDVTTRLLTRLLRLPEKYARRYLEDPSQMFPLSDNQTLEPHSRQCLNFSCEFVMNHATLAAWEAVKMDKHTEERKKNIDEFAPSLPFLAAGAIEGTGIEAATPLPYTHHLDPNRPPSFEMSPSLSPSPTPPSQDQDSVPDTPTSSQEEHRAETLPRHFTADMEEAVDVEDRYNSATLSRSGMLSERAEQFTPSVFGLELEEPLLDQRERALLVKQLPVRHSCQNWNLLYSTRLHGFSLTALLRNSEGAGPNLLVVETLEGAVFGGYSAVSYEPQQYHFGNGESLVFSVERGEVEGANGIEQVSSVQAFGWTGRNRFFVQCDGESIAFGGGKSVAFSIEGATLTKGQSGHCDTFESPPFAQDRTYTIKAVECWAFEEE